MEERVLEIDVFHILMCQDSDFDLDFRLHRRWSLFGEREFLGGPAFMEIPIVIVVHIHESVL